MDKFIKTITWLFVLAPLTYLALAWKHIPEKVATHFNLRGEPDQFGNKSQLWIGIGLIAVVSVLIFLLLTNVYRIDPKKHAAENKDRLLRIAFVIAIFMSVVSFVMIHAAVSEGGIKFNIRFVFSSIGFLWAIVGNYMHNIKPNYFAGFRLPWALENEENWRKTHLIGGKLWFAGGLCIGIMWLFVPLVIGIVLTILIFLVMIVIPIVYSYRLYKKNKMGISNGV